MPLLLLAVVALAVVALGFFSPFAAPDASADGAASGEDSWLGSLLGSVMVAGFVWSAVAVSFLYLVMRSGIATEAAKVVSATAGAVGDVAAAGTKVITLGAL